MQRIDATSARPVGTRPSTGRSARFVLMAGLAVERVSTRRLLPVTHWRRRRRLLNMPRWASGWRHCGRDSVDGLLTLPRREIRRTRWFIEGFPEHLLWTVSAVGNLQMVPKRQVL